MKLRYLCLVPLLGMATIAAADTLAEQIDALKGSLSGNTDGLQQASKDGADASAEYSRLKTQVLPQLQSDVAKYKTDRQNEDMERADLHSAYQDLGQRLAAHNGTICETTEDNPDACDGYNQEADSLDAEANKLAERRDKDNAYDAELEQQRQSLLTQSTDLSTNTQNAVTQMKEARGRYADLLQEHNRLLAKLQGLLSQVGQCKKQLKAQGNGSNDYLKNQCGDAQFDGSDYNAPVPPPDPPSN